MALDRGLRDEKTLGDLRVGIPVAQKNQHSLLSLGDAGARGRNGAQEAGDEAGGAGRGDGCSAPVRSNDGPNHLLRR